MGDKVAQVVLWSDGSLFVMGSKGQRFYGLEGRLAGPGVFDRLLARTDSMTCFKIGDRYEGTVTTSRESVVKFWESIRDRIDKPGLPG